MIIELPIYPNLEATDEPSIPLAPKIVALTPVYPCVS